MRQRETIKVGGEQTNTRDNSDHSRDTDSVLTLLLGVWEKTNRKSGEEMLFLACFVFVRM